MAQRKIKLIPQEYYHIYNRGNSKQDIFLDENDSRHFCELLYLCNQSKPVDIRDLKRNLNIRSTIFDIDRDNTVVAIGAYCLMSNHFHILISPITETGATIFMKKLSTAYSMYFNKKYNRTGSLFEGRFKSEHVNEDRYLKYLFSYIHLNPIKLINSKWKEVGISDINKALEFLSSYTYSSYSDYKDPERVESKILDIEVFPKYFPNKTTFIKEILSWINYKN